MLYLHGLTEMVFWACAVVVVYVYFGFPLLLGFVALVAPRISRKDENFRPRVSLLISAYNEAPIIREKIENSLRLSYPRSLFEVLVVSDCSSDATDEIAREYAGRGVRL